MPNPSSGATDVAAGAEVWTIVRRRRNSRSKPLPLPSSPIPKSPSPWTPADPTIDPALKSNLLLKIHSTIDRLRSTRFFHRFLQRLRDPQTQQGLAFTSPSVSTIQMVVYGVGSIALYDPPRLQLALALILRRELGDAVVSLEVFDPVLSGTECAVMEELGFRVLTCNELGRRVVESLTLFYMPHCEAGLYDGLLEVNWVKDRLNRIVILGNSFSKYRDYVEEVRGCGGGSVSVEDSARHLLSVGDYVREVGIEGNVDEGRCEEEEVGIFEAFHDTSWHFFEVSDAELKVPEHFGVDSVGESRTCSDFKKGKKKWRNGKSRECDQVEEKVEECSAIKEMESLSITC